MSPRRIVFVAIAGLLGLQGGQASFRVGLADNAAKRSAEAVDKAFPNPLTLTLPIDPALIDPDSVQVIWPFGIPGSSHPDGHPGIDFDTVLNAAVYASAAGKVREVSNQSQHSSAAEVVLIIDHAATQTTYVGSLINVTVSPGAIVTQGQKIAELGPWSLGQGRQYGFLHWGLTSFTSHVSLCPYLFLDSKGKSDLEALHARSNYQNKAQYPLICNPCAATGCR